MILLPLEFGLSSFVKINLRSVFLSTISRLGIANSGVPINIVFSICNPQPFIHLFI